MTFRFPRFLPIILWALLIGSAAVRFYSATHYSPREAIWSDPGRHWENANRMIAADVMTSIDPLLYQVWLSAAVKITDGDTRALGVYAALLSILTPWFWYRFLREAMPFKTAALAGWAVLSWLPSWIGIFSYFMIETLLLPMIGVSLWMTWRARRKKDVASFVWAAIFWTLAILTKKVAAPLACLALVWLWVTQDEKGRKAFWTVIVFAALLFPAAWRCHHMTGAWAPAGYGSLNNVYFASGRREINIYLSRADGARWRWGFMSPSLTIGPFTPFSHWSSRRTGIVNAMIRSEFQRRDWDQAYATTRAPWRERLYWQWENTIFALFGYSWPDSNPSRFWEKMNNFSRWLWCPLLVIVMIGNGWRASRTRRMDLLSLLTMAGWFLLCAAPVGVAEGRYRKPFEGLLVANALLLATRGQASGSEAAGVRRNDGTD
jgi:hypothetical protein